MCGAQVVKVPRRKEARKVDLSTWKARTNEDVTVRLCFLSCADTFRAVLSVHLQQFACSTL